MLFRSAIGAGTARSDIGAFFPAWGPNHGFDATLPVTATGSVQYCAYAINVGFGGVNPSLGCRTITISTQPFGVVDAVARVGNGIRITGWALDPDSGDPIWLHVYVDGVFRGAVLANAARPDLVAFYPGYGEAHGLDATIDGGGSRVCVFAINAGAGGVNPQLGCRTL